MALPMGKNPEELFELNDDELFDYFSNFARYISDSPRLCYAIMYGSHTLMSDDTADLFEQFKRKVKTKGEKK